MGRSMLGRLCTAGLVVAAIGCRAQTTDAPGDGGAGAMAPTEATPRSAVSPEALVADADQALEEGRAAEAVALYGRALAADPLDDGISRAATLGLARAHEQLHDCAAVIRAYDAYLERFPAAEDRVVVHAHRGACEAELGAWEASAASFGEVAAADDQLPSTRVEALARQGYALFNLDRFDDADAVLGRADEVFERAQREQSERFSTYYFVGMARFYRGAILHRRFRDVAIVLPENVMAQRFAEKLALLTRAQEAYNHAIKAKHMFWVSAAGFQLGNLFGEFYDALMYAPVPEWLDDKQRRTYYEELKKQLRPVVDKAIWVLEKNLETARRLGYESEFTAQTEVKLSHLQRVLGSGEATLGQPHVRLAGDLPDAAGGSREGTTTPGIEGPAAGVVGADRKLFVPPMSPLVP
jgi:tetratricopeptide (TPR) repeat protein